MKDKPFYKVGIGVTFSPNLEANICEASRISLLFGAELTLIHVGKHTSEKENVFKKFLKPFKKNGLIYDIVFKSGNPVGVILSVYEEKEIDLLMLGALRRESFFKYYLGSIARKITRKAKCSIMLLINPSVNQITCKHIVVNGLENPKTEDTINYAFFVAHRLKVEKITVVEEISQEAVAIKVEDNKSLKALTLKKKRLREQENSRIQKIISQIPSKFKNAINVTTQPIFGKRGYSIGHYAEIVRADLLITNAVEESTLWDRIFPHDLEHILTELPTDVLIIR